MRKHGFTVRDFRRAFQEAGVEGQSDIALSRLCSGVPQRDDEGYAHLLSNPPSIEDMKMYFVELRTNFEIESASQARIQRDLAGDG